jgi:hypothetical protein
MGEIIIFAQKREQSLLEVPICISTLSGEAMEAAGCLRNEERIQTLIEVCVRSIKAHFLNQSP